MSKDSAVVLAPWASLITNDRVTRFVSREEPVDLTEAHLGRIAEWLAVAWANVTGEEYEHQGVGVRIDTKEFTEILRVERDCE